MKKTLKFLGLFVALCVSHSVGAQTLLYDAAGSGNSFVKINGTANYALNLNGNTVSDGNIIMTAGARAVGLTVSPAISPYSSGGVTVVMFVSNVDVTRGGQFMSLRTSPNDGQGGLKIKTGALDGTVHATWTNNEWGNITAGKFPTDGEKHVVSYAYIRNGENGGNGSAFYINKTSLGNFTALQSSNSIGEIAFGGISTTNSSFLNTGMRIHRIQVYSGQLTAAQIAAATDNIKLPTEINDLTQKMGEVLSVINNSPIGNNPGQFTQENFDTLRVAFDAAAELAKGELTETEIANATAVLEAAKNKFLATMNSIKISTAGNETWYYINGVVNYADNKSISMNTAVAGGDINFASQALHPTKLFKFEDVGNNRVSLKNFATGKYIGGTAKVSNTPSPLNVTYLGQDAQYTLNEPGRNPLHAQNTGSLLVTYSGGLNSGSAWRFIEVPAADIQKKAAIKSVTTQQGFTVTGIGNNDHPLMYATLDVEGVLDTCKVKSVKFDFSASSSISSIEKVKIYKIGTSEKRFVQSRAVLLGEAKVENNVVELTFDPAEVVELGITKWAITVDISENATEGELVKATLVDIEQESGAFAVNLTTDYPTQIFLTQSLVIAPGDYNSVSYRIPAIAVADDGAIIAVTDKRIGHAGDLPANIDLIVQRSTDNGKTWSTPMIIAGGENSSGSNGFGDAAIIKDRTNGKLIILCVAGPGFFTSSASSPIRIEYFESTDNGLTWSKNRDITPMIYGSQASNSITRAWNGVFPASGRMLQTRSGRIISALLVRNPATGGHDNFMMYSDDSGLTWSSSTSMAVRNGDEAKLAQRNDGKVIISSRRGGGRVWNVSNDNTGLTWTQTNQTQRSELPDVNCNGELMTYTSTLDGFDKNRMLHSLCVGPGGRRNVSMTISYNEGGNWQKLKTICPTASAYSTFDILPDGTIGMYYEDGTHGGTAYEMVYVRFSLDWLTDGADTYIPPTVTSVNGSVINPVKVNVVNNKVTVTGTKESPKVFTLSGAQINAKSTLEKGVYVVSVAGTSTKIIVN